MTKKIKKNKNRDVSIVLAGQAGQGIMTIEKILTHVLKEEGFCVFATREYMSRVRGGVNSTQIRVSNAVVSAPVERVDIFVALDAHVFERYCDRLSKATVVIGDARVVAACKCGSVCENALTVSFREIANEVGHSIYANTVAAGTLLALLEVPVDRARDVLRVLFAQKGQKVVQNNITALERGYKQGGHVAFLRDAYVGVPRAHKEYKEYVFLAGYEAVALGALAGGVDFCTSYPMSPSTGVLTYLAQHGRECGVVVEQATDEIGAVNMSVGAAYAGARPIVTTSGGGFALMEEAISLAAMVETPLTIHLAQRPGPATGLPTRTAQEDLNLVLYAGHGEFARAIFAPGTVSEAFIVTQIAVEMADKYQMPTFVLTDQYFVDSLAMAREEDFVFSPVHKYIVETEPDYKRYALTQNGLSPRGVPGYGDGLVCADSDAHDETGHISEDVSLHVTMTNKRRKRLNILKKEALMPTRSGARGKKARKAFIVWGSNYHVADEAVRHADVDDVVVLHFAQVYPINPRVKTVLADMEIVAVMENNASGQFADLLVREMGCTVDARITKYNGMPFTVEEVIDAIEKL